MDFYPALQWRHAIRRRHRMPLESCEFMPHADRIFLVDWRSHPLSSETVDVRRAAAVEPRFEPVAGRMLPIIDRYYDELATRTPSARFHHENVKEALLLAAACLRAVAEWFDDCRAPAEVIEEMFTMVRDSVGQIATSSNVYGAVRAEELAHSTILRMDRRRRAAGCAPQRIFA